MHIYAPTYASRPEPVILIFRYTGAENSLGLDIGELAFFQG